VGDFNKDNGLDLVVVNHGSDTIDIFLGYGNGSLVKPKTYAMVLGTAPYFVTVRDLNNDRIPDIVVVNHGTHSIGVLLGFGDGTFADPTFFQLKYGSFPFFVVVADFNNDKKVDFAVANSGTDNLYILLQTC
jgi:FG-GAP-like repeat